MAASAPLSRRSQTFFWVVLFFSVASILIQLLLFLPSVSYGQALDLALYRIDSLNLMLGVLWSVAAALVIAGGFVTAEKSSLQAASLLVVSICMLNMVYARELWWLYLWLEIAAVGLWVAVRPVVRRARQAPSPLLYLSGLPLILLIVLDQSKALAPPPGGSTQPWSLLVVIGLVGVVLLRSGTWLYSASYNKNDNPAQGSSIPLAGLYILFMPALLAKALVAAPWGVAGIWVVALLGTVGLIGSTGAAIAMTGRARILAIACALSASAVIGLGLSPGSPSGAAGALALILSSSIWMSVAHTRSSISLAPVLLLGSMLGVWLVAQAALGLGYGIVAALLLPVMLALVLVANREAHVEGSGTMEAGGGAASRLMRPAKSGKSALVAWAIAALLLAGVAVYPQASVEMVLRPAVQAMAGGVGVLSSVRSDPGVGLLVYAPQGTVLAALPSTGIAVAVFLAFVTLYWLRRLLARFAGKYVDTETE